MSKRDGLGLLLFAMGVIIAPFGYWLNSRWALVAATLAIPGLLLILLGRFQRRRSTAFDNADSVDLPPGRHDLKGFRGAGVLDANGADTHD